MFKKSVKIITHNGSFHADDLFACATLSIMLEDEGHEVHVVRTRDIDSIKEGDFVFDVGGIYDASINRFDHHQREGAGARDNGIPYSSFGLIWKHFGLKLCDGDEDVWNKIDRWIVSPIDANDNGVDLVIPKFPGIFPYTGPSPFLVFSPTWQEEARSNIDDIFKNEVRNVMRVLRREIEVAKSDSYGKKLILEDYERAPDKRVVELTHPYPRYLYQDVLSRLPDTLYMIQASNFGESWKVEAVTKSPETLESRKPFPEPWRGYANGDLVLKEVTGVDDIIFSHRGGFLINVGSKEGALKLAQIALEA